jgi:hypothetical protein
VWGWWENLRLPDAIIFFSREINCRRWYGRCTSNRENEDKNHPEAIFFLYGKEGDGKETESLFFNFLHRDLCLDFKSKSGTITGLRLIRQDPWECFLSFLCSQNNNIPRITSMIDNLCTWGEREEGGGRREEEGGRRKEEGGRREQVRYYHWPPSHPARPLGVLPLLPLFSE